MPNEHMRGNVKLSSLEEGQPWFHRALDVKHAGG